MARKRVAKKEQDVFQRTFMGLFQQLSGAGLALTGLLLALLVVMAVLWGISSSQEEAESAAWEKVDRALKIRDANERMAKLEEVVNEISDTGAHPSVVVALAARLHDKALEPATSDSKRAELLKRARSLYEGAVRNYPDHPLAPKARANLAKVLEDSGEYKLAYDAYAEAAAKCADTDLAFLGDRMLWGQARCALKQGNEDDALKLLNRVVARHERRGGAGNWLAAARHLRESLRKVVGDENRILDGVERDTPPKKKEEEKKEKADKPGEEKKGGASGAGK
jgi:tetratricopeptide (TPR) repeat protein